MIADDSDSDSGRSAEFKEDVRRRKERSRIGREGTPLDDKGTSKELIEILGRGAVKR